MKLTPLHRSETLGFFPATTGMALDLPLIDAGIHAGFPSPVEDFVDISIDLNKELIKNPSATFYARVKGNSMVDAGIHDGDLIIIDKSLEPTNGKIAVCFIDGEFTIKRIKIDRNCCWLVPANDDFNPIRVTDENDFLVWGIVVHVIRSL
ncbi:MAG: translesion error-prone DNA polymerase V autoproteolytic subunit [Bacteroidetes bacterium]|nr:translesion error-prone DNA polymerase V autoproteolytic subunit [Bacteroidota bacterium]